MSVHRSQWLLALLSSALMACNLVLGLEEGTERGTGGEGAADGGAGGSGGDSTTSGGAGGDSTTTGGAGGTGGVGGGATCDTPIAGGDELIQNGSFEAGLVGWSSPALELAQGVDGVCGEHALGAAFAEQPVDGMGQPTYAYAEVRQSVTFPGPGRFRVVARAAEPGSAEADVQLRESGMATPIAEQAFGAPDPDGWSSVDLVGCWEGGEAEFTLAFGINANDVEPVRFDCVSIVFAPLGE